MHSLKVLSLVGFTALIAGSDDAGDEKLSVRSRVQLLQEAEKKREASINHKEVSKVKKKIDRSKKVTEVEKMYLYSRGMWTYVPKTSVLHVPKSLRRHVILKPKGEVVTWDDFLRSNRSIIYTVPVTLQEVRAETKINERIIRSYYKTAKIVIATYRGGPITVNPSAVDHNE